MEEYKQFGELSRDKKLELMTAWVDGESIEAYSGFGKWTEVPTVFAWWPTTSIIRIASKPVVKPSINWDHVSEKFVALAIDKNGKAYLFREVPKPDYEEWFDTLDYCALAESHESFNPGSFTPSEEGIVDNWKNSLVLRPGHNSKDRA